MSWIEVYNALRNLIRLFEDVANAVYYTYGVKELVVKIGDRDYAVRRRSSFGDYVISHVSLKERVEVPVREHSLDDMYRNLGLVLKVLDEMIKMLKDRVDEWEKGRDKIYDVLAPHAVSEKL